MIGESPLSIREFLMNEPLPIGAIHDAVLEFIRDRDDVVLFGAQAVNIYVDVPRLTQDVDVQSIRGRELADELQRFLHQRFQIAVRVRDVRDGLGFRVYQVRKDGNRHLVDVRPVPVLPPAQRIGGFLVVVPEELIANKVAALVSRKHKPKSGTDWRDLAMMLLTFPDLKSLDGPVRERLLAHNADAAVFTAWDELVAQDITPEDDEDEFL